MNIIQSRCMCSILIQCLIASNGWSMTMLTKLANVLPETAPITPSTHWLFGSNWLSEYPVYILYCISGWESCESHNSAFSCVTPHNLSCSKGRNGSDRSHQEDQCPVWWPLLLGRHLHVAPVKQTRPLRFQPVFQHRKQNITSHYSKLFWKPLRWVTNSEVTNICPVAKATVTLSQQSHRTLNATLCQLLEYV